MRPQDGGPAVVPEQASLDRTARAGLEPFELYLDAEPDAGAAARAAVSAWIGAAVSPAMRVDLLLLISELVTNSVRHAHAPAASAISVRARIRGDVLRVEVGDGGTGGAIARRAPNLGNGGGFGLNVVELVSQRWGVDRARGTRVWAEMAFSPAG
jgi:anti-sigma regulatory factor (Ser/Thr protein kinase)